MLLTILAAAFASTLVATPAVPQGVRIEGRIVDQSDLPLPGVTVRLTALDGRGPVAGTASTTVTGQNGDYRFDVAAGDYRVEAELDGFERTAREVHASASPVVANLVLAIAHYTEQTTVVATPPTEVQPRQFGAPATIAEGVIDNAPLKTNRFDDVLPLLPGVVRGPDGLLSVAGARAPQGIVLLNGIPALDVVTGEPLATVPLEAVESLQVISTGYPAEFGMAAGGVTMINSRAGADALRFSVNSFTPRPRLTRGGVYGIESWEPNAGLRGPIRKGRAWFAQSLDYRYDRTAADTLAGSQDRRVHGLNSLTQVDTRVSPSSLLTASFNAQVDRVEGEGLNAFSPLSTRPELHRHTFSGGLIDRSTFGSSSTLEARVQVARQQLALLPQGDSPYLVAHDITRGSYFNTQDRHALSVYGSAVLSRAWSGGSGQHLLKVGATVTRNSADGINRSQPVEYLQSDMRPAVLVEFAGDGAFRVDGVETGVFVADAWTPSNGLRVDAGVRFDAATFAPAAAAPRAGMTWRVDERTTITGGAGVFADKIPLAALAYSSLQARIVTRFDAAGTPLGAPVRYASVLDGRLRRPYSGQWSVQAERTIGETWRVRVNYQERHGHDELVVAPEIRAAGDGVAALSSAGISRSRTLDATVGFRPAPWVQRLYVSYVRTSTLGNTNDLNQVDGTFRDALLLADQVAPLGVEAPHRLLVWGVFALPSRITVAPFFEARSGFPYSALRDDWSLAGPANTRRYPALASLDLVVNKIVTLPTGLRARVGVKLYNVAGRRNGRDVQADIDRTDFGTTYNALGRQLRGVFEILWGGPAK